ncbi:hypothetical protein ACIPWL_20775 [Streptomyces sp. NPDC090023]
MHHETSSTMPPVNAFVPVPGCWICALLATLAHAGLAHELI